MSLTFEELRRKNLEQCRALYGSPPEIDVNRWLIVEYGVLHDLLRTLLNQWTVPEHDAKLRQQIGDIVLMLDLFLANRNESLENVVRTRFNVISQLRDLPLTL
jgi:hypothetical protein